MERKCGNADETNLEWSALSKAWGNISYSFKLAFISACIIGFIVHLYVFTNLILNHDSVWRIFYDNDNLTSGRWFLKVISDISTQFQVPVVNGFISIFMLALCAGITVRCLEISNRFNIILASGFIVSVPAVAAIFSYMFTADAYFVALAFNAVAVYLTKKYKYGWIPAILLITIASGIYQAFICYAIGLFLFDCILELFSDARIDKIVKQGAKYILIIGTSLILYLAILKLLVFLRGIALSSYQGLNSMSLTNIGAFLSRIPLAYKGFYNYLYKMPYSLEIFQLIQAVFSVLFYGALIYLVVALKIYKDKTRLALLVVGALLLPLALNFITILSVGANVHALMIYSFVLYFIFTIKLIEMALQKMFRAGKSKWLILHVISLGFCCLLIWNNFCISNMAYLRLKVCYENSYALANRVVSHVEALEGYSPDLPVAIVGEASRKLYGGTVSGFSQINSLTGTNDILLFSPEPHQRTRKFLEHYIGIRMKKPTQEQFALLNNSDVIKNMPAYPKTGSVILYENVVVIKFSDGKIR